MNNQQPLIGFVSSVRARHQVACLSLCALACQPAPPAAGDAGADAALVDSDAGRGDASLLDRAASHGDAPVQDAAGCDLGLPAWDGGDYQGRRDALLTFADADDSIEVQLARLWQDQGIGESSIYALGGFYLRDGDEEVCVTSEAQLDYTNSHHNWRDQAVADSGDRRFMLDLIYGLEDGTWSYQLWFYVGGQLTRGPIALALISGPHGN